MARISYTAPPTPQQVQIERIAKNSKPRNGFDFSYTRPATATPTLPSRLPSHYDAVTRCQAASGVVVRWLCSTDCSCPASPGILSRGDALVDDKLSSANPLVPKFSKAKERRVQVWGE